MTYLKEGTLLQGIVHKIFSYGAQVRIAGTNRRYAWGLHNAVCVALFIFDASFIRWTIIRKIIFFYFAKMVRKENNIVFNYSYAVDCCIFQILVEGVSCQ